MKRSEMLDHIKEDLLEKLKHRWLEQGETDKWADFTANQLLDMIEGFGMLPPPDNTDVIHGSLVYCYYIDKTYADCERVVEVEDSCGKLDYSRSKLWEPEDEIKLK